MQAAFVVWPAALGSDGECLELDMHINELVWMCCFDVSEFEVVPTEVRSPLHQYLLRHQAVTGFARLPRVSLTKWHVNRACKDLHEETVKRLHTEILGATGDDMTEHACILDLMRDESPDMTEQDAFTKIAIATVDGLGDHALDDVDLKTLLDVCNANDQHFLGIVQKGNDEKKRESQE